MSRRVHILSMLLLLVAAAPVAAQDPVPAGPGGDVLMTGVEPESGEHGGVDELVGEEMWGLKVLSIDYQVPDWMSDAEIKRVSKIKKDRPLTRWRVRSSLRRFYLLGYVDNAVVKAKQSGEGLKVTVKIYPRYQLRDIEVRGMRDLNYADIVEDTLGLQMGDDFRLEDLPVWEQKIKDAYRDIGHLKAQVEIQYEKTKLKDDNKVDLRIEINERQQYDVEEIAILGDLGPFTHKQILRKLKWRPGMSYSRERVDDGLDRLKAWLKKQKHFEARVGDIDLDNPQTVRIEDAKSRMFFTLRLDVGPRVDIAYDDECYTCAQKKWKINDHLDVENNRRFTQWIVKPYEEKIEQYFQTRGYLDAQAQGTFEELKDEETGLPAKRLHFTLAKGRKYKVEDIDFKNNPSFDDATLEDKLDAGSYFVAEDFDKSLENVISHYNENGFIAAKITHKSAEIDEGTGEIHLTIVVSEGPQAKINSVELVGNKVLKRDRLKGPLEEAGLLPGNPYNPFKVDETRTKMIAKYLTRGYIKARIRETIKVSDDGTQVDVRFEFTEGDQYFYGDVYVHGNKLTKKHVILRELFVTKGDPFNYEDVFASQQQVMKLGFFSSVDIRPVDEEIDEKTVDLLVTVEERNSGYIESGLGYNTYSGYQGAFEIGHRNLAGHGRKLSIRNDVYFRDESFRFDQRTTALNFVWPWVARVPMDGDVLIKDDQRHQIGYDLRELSITTGLFVDFPKFFYNQKSTRRNETVRELSKYWSGKLSYAYIRDFLFNISPDVEDQKAGEVQIATITPQLTRDSRDNPFNPTDGKVYMVMLEWGSPPLLSQINYLKAVGQLSYYYPVFRLWKAKNGPVLAFNVKTGRLQELRETDTVPINRRFYLGGSTTIRGFGQDQISPMAEGTNTPIGGYFFGYSNVEARIPIGDTNVGILTFWDAGNVTSEFKEFYLDKLRTTAGLGLRYITPVGPISADYGFKLNREPEESIGEFYITVGNAF